MVAEVFETTPKRWGNSLGVTLPATLAKKLQLDVDTPVRVLLLPKEPTPQQKTFGTLKSGKPIEEMMREIDEGYHE